MACVSTASQVPGELLPLAIPWAEYYVAVAPIRGVTCPKWEMLLKRRATPIPHESRQFQLFLVRRAAYGVQHVCALPKNRKHCREELHVPSRPHQVENALPE